MIREVWGTAGTAGELGWEYGTATPTIGTALGTAILHGLDDLEAGTIGTAYTYNGGTWYNRVYLNEGVSAQFRQTVMIGNTGNKLYYHVSQTNQSPYKVMMYWLIDYGGGTIGTVGSHTETRSGAYEEYISTTISYDDDADNCTASMTLQAVAGSGTTATLTHDYTFIDPFVEINPTFAMDTGGVSEIIYPHYIPPDKTVIDFFGSYNNGSNIGTLALGTYALDIGKVREQLYSPKNTRGWSSKVSVTLDDITDWWTGTLAMDMGNPQWLDGTWWIRQQWGGTWHNLLTGFVTPDNITYDFGEKTIKLGVSSILEKVAKTTLVPHKITWLGTIHDMEYDGSKGRILLHRGSELERGTMYVNEYVWAGSGTDNENTRITHFWDNHKEVWSGTWKSGGGGSYWTKSVYFENDADWLEEGGSLWISESSRSYGYTPNYKKFFGFLDNVITNTVDQEDGAGLNMAWNGTAERQFIDVYEGTKNAIRYYGGERVIDILHDMTQSIGLSYSVNGDGTISVYMQKPIIPAPSGTINFNEIFADSWGFSYTKPVNNVRVKYNYDCANGKTLSEYTFTGGNYYAGDDTTIECGWLNPTRYEAIGRAQRESWINGIPRMELTVKLPGSTYATYSPGNSVVLENVPAIISDQGSAGNWVIAARNYDYKSDLIEYDLIHHRIAPGLFRLDYSEADGPDILW